MAEQEITPVEGAGVKLGFDPEKMPSLDGAIGEGAELTPTVEETSPETIKTPEGEQTPTEPTTESAEGSSPAEGTEPTKTSEPWLEDKENDLRINDENHAKSFIPTAQKFIKTLEGENATLRRDSVTMLTTIEKLQQENEKLRKGTNSPYSDVSEEEYQAWQKSQEGTKFNPQVVLQNYRTMTDRRNAAMAEKWKASNHPDLTPQEMDAIYNLANETQTGIRLNEFGFVEFAGPKSLEALFMMAFPGRSISQSQKAAEKQVKESLQKAVAAPKSTGSNGTTAVQSPLMPHEAKTKYGEDSSEYKKSFAYWMQKVPLGE